MALSDKPAVNPSSCSISLRGIEGLMNLPDSSAVNWQDETKDKSGRIPIGFRTVLPRYFLLDDEK
jgi:hypothetical protein